MNYRTPAAASSDRVASHAATREEGWGGALKRPTGRAGIDACAIQVQDFVSLAESLEWELGQQYLRERGNKAFLSDAWPVQFVINNDGTLPHNAAEVLFASLVNAEAEADPLTPDPSPGGRGGKEEIFVLELGIGVGLFARFFVDHFEELRRKHPRDFYDRLCYVAADKS